MTPRRPARGRLALTLGYLLTAACSPPPDVLLITVDTLRADHLGCYGARDVHTPHVDDLAADGLLFERAVAPLPETRPSHVSIFTSLYPADHGVLSNAALFPGAAALLPQLFRDAGYATAGVVASALFDVAGGHALGFEDFDAPAALERPASEVVASALRWLDDQPPSGRPFFLWLHLFDPHIPYEPRAGDPEPAQALSWDVLHETADRHAGDVPREVLERALDLYAGEVETVDHWLGVLFAELRATHRYDDTVIVFTSDHGECFENGVFFDHSHCLGEGALAVPLILHHPPQVAPGRSAATVELLDVAPTLLRLAGLPVPESFTGRDLLARRGSARAGYAFFQYPFYRVEDVENRRRTWDRVRSVAGEPTRPVVGDRPRFGVRSGRWKYLLDGDREILYDLERDPDELLDVSDGEPERTRELRDALRRWQAAHPLELRGVGDLDPALVERLRALGYL